MSIATADNFKLTNPKPFNEWELYPNGDGTYRHWASISEIISYFSVPEMSPDWATFKFFWIAGIYNFYTGTEFVPIGSPGNIKGIAFTNTTPQAGATPDAQYIYFAGPGTYANFPDTSAQPIVLTENLNVISWDGTAATFQPVPVDVDTSGLVPKSDITTSLTETVSGKVLDATTASLFATKKDVTDTGAFNGTSSEVDITPDFILENQNDAVEFRAKLFNTAIDNFGILGTKGIGGSNFIGFPNGGNIMRIRTSNGDQTSLNLPSGTDVTVFHKYKLVKTATGYTLYVDGTLAYSADNPNTLVVNNIGQAYGTVYVAMQMSDIVFYKAGAATMTIANPAFAQTGVTPTDVAPIATKSDQEKADTDAAIAALSQSVKDFYKGIASTSKNWFTEFSNTPVSTLDFDKSYELDNIGDAIEFEFSVTDTADNLGLIGTKSLAASNWFGVKADNRIYLRDNSGNNISSRTLKTSKNNKIRLEVTELGYTITVNNCSVESYSKIDKFVFNNIGRAYSASTNGNFRMRNFKYFQGGVQKIDLPELFNAVNSDGTAYTIANVSKKEPSKSDTIRMFLVGFIFILSYGQSLMLGTTNTGDAAISKELYSNITFADGVRAGTEVGGTDMSSTIPLQEKVEPTSTNLTETHISTMLNYLTFLCGEDDLDTDFSKFFGSTAARGGTSLISLSDGTAPFDRLKAQIDAAYTLSNFDFFVLVALIWGQGEADYTSTSGSTTYYARMISGILDPVQAYYESVTGNTNMIQMFSYQLASHLFYAYASQPGGAGGEDRPAAKVPYIALQQKKAGDTYPDRVRVVLPMYIFDYLTEQNLHLKPYEYAHMGAYFGKALYRVFMDDHDFRPLAPIWVKKRSDNASFDMKFNVEKGRRLEWDDVVEGGLVTAIQDKGFEVYDSTGRLAISSVEIISNDTVRVILQAAIAGTGPYVTYGFGTDITTVQVGRTTGPRGQLRDNDGDLFQCTAQDGRLHRLHNYCLIFQENIV